VGRFGQLLAARGVRTTFSRIGGHSANPCATLHARKRRVFSVNKGRLRPNSRAKAMVGPPPLPMRTARAEVGHYRRRDRRGTSRISFHVQWPTQEQTHRERG